MNNVLVVTNFNAGRQRALKYKKKVISFLIKNSNKFKFITIDEFETIDIQDFDTIIAMGGDGTINKVLPYVINSDKHLGIIPCGTANLLASKLKIPFSINKALKTLAKRKIKTIDAIQINEKLGVLRFGLGYDSNIICKTPQSLKNKFGYFSYFIAGCLFALRLKSIDYEICMDNSQTKLKTKASCIIVANAPNMYKNLVSIATNGQLDDNMLDVFILKTTNPIIFFIEFLLILLNIKRNTNRANYFKVQNIKINNKWNYAHIDGEKTKYDKDIEIKIIPKSINILIN